MTQTGESSFIGQEQTPPLEPDQTPVKIRYCLFFDGTLNNRSNVFARKYHHQLLLQESGGNEIYVEYGKEDNSYANDYSNIARMEKYIDEAENYDFTLSSYIEGPGTRDEDSDTLRGAAFGTGTAGITAKVEKGLVRLLEDIGQAITDEDKQVITKLSIDVFGFSRGAACARNFIYKAVQQQHVKHGLTTRGIKIWKTEITFAGLYDTVSSHGLSFSNDTRALSLRAVNSAKKTVQLAAAEEYRKNFSLTNILSCGSFGKTIFIPGAHSDVGGGYNEGSTEERTINWSYSTDILQQDRQQLIDEGWYRPDEIWVEEPPEAMMGASYGSMPPPSKLKIRREEISNEYSKIPMHIMAYFAEVEGLILKPIFYRDESIIPQLSSVKDSLLDYAKKDNSQALHWQSKHSISLFLRHDYLHFSAHYSSIGMSPRFKNFSRIRKTYNG